MACVPGFAIFGLDFGMTIANLPLFCNEGDFLLPIHP